MFITRETVVIVANSRIIIEYVLRAELFSVLRAWIEIRAARIYVIYDSRSCRPRENR